MAARKTERHSPDSDPLWFKDAVIYQLHVRAFADSNADGIGDFPGLTQKLDYIQELGVTAIWLLPFFPSPLRDDGYDIADYYRVNPSYGDLRDFKRFLKEAHDRGLRVITELVMNHTSDQHEWFQKSRRAEKGSKWRDFYVWSDDPHQYSEARIIFQDFESSNWSWDPVAQAYYWHRFYHHQPDLNFDNPAVRKEMTRIFDFWLGMGVDGVRLDAVPYLFEREGTNCENLPETHQFLKELRRHVDEKFEGRLLLAEANQWPEDAVAYFGDGDECHMNFHFPLMPRLFMALEREDRFPIIDILDQTPKLPENSQWAIFLRNHDELTLEMVTDEERDYMYRAYAENPRARVNLGIRRRLAPLLKNNRRKIELMNALLLSLPGTPIVYYGDELGMGDNIYLGDRDGVRTPMQWNADQNAGFSRANPHRLFLPVIIDSEYHYTARNVEVDRDSPHSLLWWMQRVINLRKQFRCFGRGNLEFLSADNSKVLAFLREFEGETLLVVANLSRFSQCCEIDLNRFRRSRLVELFGQAEFPPIAERPYFLTLGPHSFYWFKIESPEEQELDPAEELPLSRLREGIENVFKGRARSTLENALSQFLRRQNWFNHRHDSVRSVSIQNIVHVGRQDDTSSRFYLILARVTYLSGEPETYLVPAFFLREDEGESLLADHPQAGILRIHELQKGIRWMLCDASLEQELWQGLFSFLARKKSSRWGEGEVHAHRMEKIADTGFEEGQISVRTELSNVSAVLGESYVLKLFRRIDEGENPELEVGRFLSEVAPLEQVPEILAYLEMELDGSPKAPFTLATLHEFRAHAGDGWNQTVDELSRFFEEITSFSEDELSLPEIPQRSVVEMTREDLPPLARDLMGPYLQVVEAMGRRTAEMHLALSSNYEIKAFRPEPFNKLYRRSVYQSLRTQIRRSNETLLKEEIPESLVKGIENLMSSESVFLSYLRQIIEREIRGERIRCHGDYRLGQVLFTGADVLIIDFEGHAERRITERRIKTSPLRDVASMIRSFEYAADAACLGKVPGVVPQLEKSWGVWTDFWRIWATSTFLRSYLEIASEGSFLPEEDEALEIMTYAYLIEKAYHELRYEIENRPEWVEIPLRGLNRFQELIRSREAE